MVAVYARLHPGDPANIDCDMCVNSGEIVRFKGKPEEYRGWFVVPAQETESIPCPICTDPPERDPDRDRE